MLISNQYKELNQKLHSAGDFGKSGYRWVNTIATYIDYYEIKSLLDYGAGQQTLEKSLKKFHRFQSDLVQILN